MLLVQQEGLDIVILSQLYNRVKRVADISSYFAKMCKHLSYVAL